MDVDVDHHEETSDGNYVPERSSTPTPHSSPQVSFIRFIACLALAVVSIRVSSCREFFMSRHSPYLHSNLGFDSS